MKLHLGTFIMIDLVKRAEQPDVIAAILVATATMLIVAFAKPGPFAALAWPWYVPLGTTITLLVGFSSSRLRPALSSK